MKEILADYNFTELKRLAEEMGERPFRAKQLFDGVMRDSALAPCLR